LAHVWATLQSCRRFRRLLREIKPDIIHAGAVNSAAIVGALSGFRPMLLMPWGSDILVFPDTKGFLYRLMARYIIRRSAMITCDAELVKKKILSLTPYAPDHIVIFPWGIDLHQFHPSPELRHETRTRLGIDNSKVLVMNRTLLPVYGIDYFLRALPRVFEEEPAARVFLIGDGPLKSSLYGLVEELRLGDRVFLLGDVPNEQMPAYLNAADIYVSTSLSDGTSTSLLEAMACGLPVIVSDAPANLEWVKDGENGFVVERRNVEKIAGSILELLRNEPLARRMRELNLKIASQRADWDTNYAALEGMYRQIETLVNLDGKTASTRPDIYRPAASTSVHKRATSDD
jgi:glycosyltransferase involved in cell wall biosynthesis